MDMSDRSRIRVSLSR